MQSNVYTVPIARSGWVWGESHSKYKGLVCPEIFCQGLSMWDWVLCEIVTDAPIFHFITEIYMELQVITANCYWCPSLTGTVKRQHKWHQQGSLLTFKNKQRTSTTGINLFAFNLFIDVLNMKKYKVFQTQRKEHVHLFKSFFFKYSKDRLYIPQKWKERKQRKKQKLWNKVILYNFK